MPLSDLNLAVVMSSLAQGKNNNPQVGAGRVNRFGCFGRPLHEVVAVAAIPIAEHHSSVGLSFE
jgi:hypothetical protein